MKNKTRLTLFRFQFILFKFPVENKESDNSNQGRQTIRKRHYTPGAIQAPKYRKNKKTGDKKYKLTRQTQKNGYFGFAYRLEKVWKYN